MHAILHLLGSNYGGATHPHQERAVKTLMGGVYAETASRQSTKAVFHERKTALRRQPQKVAFSSAAV
jgi:hypothetical protein